MKTFKLFLFFCLFGAASCSDKEEKSVVDCLGDAILTSIDHSASAQNSSLINFEVKYSGNYILDSTVKWDFGDGKQQTGTGKTISHTYTAPGTYHVIGKVSVNNGGCIHDVKETVVIPQ